VILAAHHEQDVRRLKGTLRSLPVTRAAFWIGCLGGAGLIPWLSAGFFTKEAVLESLRASSLDGFGLHVPGGLLYGATLAVESLSALYLFRLLGYLSGDDREAAYAGEDGPLQGGHGEKNRSMRLVLALLAAAAPAFAFFSGRPAFLRWVTGGNGEADALHWGPVLPALAANWILAAVCFLAFSSARRRQALSGVLGRFKLPAAGPLARRFYFDDAYNVLILLPVKVLAWACRLTLENLFITAPVFAGWAGQGVSLMLRRLQTGRVQQYAAWMLLAAAAGACFLLWN
jgi:NADH:ubiquinone oxidoreductase subunit 5 (subunit L)/multisubunit Na+/H+ antiporter MnhA subunit